MSSLVIQYLDKPLTETYSRISSSHFRSYAKKYNAEYKLLSDKVLGSPYFEYLRIVFNSEYDSYDKILVVDIDIAISNFEENIFETEVEDIAMVPESVVHGLDGPTYFQRPNIMATYESKLRSYDNSLEVKSSSHPNDVFLMFNSGVSLWSREGRIKAREVFDDWKRWNNSSDAMSLDQPYLNAMVTNKLNYLKLPAKWNTPPKPRFKEIPEEMNFVHYTGGKKAYMHEYHKELL